MAVGEEIILNAGDEPVVLLIAGLTRAGEPFTTIMTDMEEMGAPSHHNPVPQAEECRRPSWLGGPGMAHP